MGKTNEENKTADIQQTDGQSPKEKDAPKEKPNPYPAPVRMGGGVCC